MVKAHWQYRAPGTVVVVLLVAACAMSWGPLGTSDHSQSSTPPGRATSEQRVILAALMPIGHGSASEVEGGGNDYPTTPDGRTFGTLPTGDEQGLAVSDLPDLIAAVGEQGRHGYITREAFMGGPAPSSPGEALAAQEKAEAVTVPVYAEDGTTVIDTFTITGPNDGQIMQESGEG